MGGSGLHCGVVADLNHRVPSSVAAVPRWARWARRLGAAVVSGVVSAALMGPVPVKAQLPELFPSTQPTTTAPASSESTLLPPLEHLATTTAPPPGSPSTTGLLNLPTAAPGSTLLPDPTLLPAPPKPTRLTAYNTLPVPPRSGLRVTTSTLQGSIRASTVAAAPDVEGGDADANFEETLPFTPEDELIQAAGLDAELGGGGESDDSIVLLASIAGGLLALVMLGVVGWLQSQVRARPHLW